MFRKTILLIAVGFFVLSCGNGIQEQESQATFIEEVQKKGDELVIPYKKYKLDNGLTLIVHEDNSDPVVHVDVTYHVGSGREEIGKSGFAHFFEHMMFQGSDNVADEEHFKIVTESGGTLNGSTNRDRTNYYETLPKNQLETALWLEADRMGFLLDAVTQQKFEVQRETVKNERGQRVDNRPYGLAYEKIGEHLYPYGHPYSWTTIGYIEDLNSVDVQDLKNFFLRWYGPNNATITIGGDVDAEEVVKKVEKYFGSIPAGPPVENEEAMPAKLEQDRYISYEDNYIRLPQLYMVFPSVPQYHKDEPALDALAEIIGQGKNSILYKNLEKPKKAVFASVSNRSSELSGEFMAVVRPYPGQNLAEMEKTLRASLKEFEEKGVDDDALARFKASYETSQINGLQSVSGKASRLAAYETYTGNPNYIQENLKAYLSVTKEDIIRVYNEYIKDKPAVILSVVPKGKTELVAAKDNYTRSKEGYTPGPDQYKGLAYNKAKDDFDRSKKPEIGENPVVSIPDYWTDNFENGIKVIGTKNDEVPSVVLYLTMKGGHLLSANDPSKAGIAELTASMLNEDTKNYTAEEFSNELNKLGSSIRVSSNSETFTVSVQSLTKNIQPTLEFLKERLMNPDFKEETFDRLKKEQLESIDNQNTQPGSIAGKVYDKLLYGEGHILGVPGLGTTATINTINVGDVQAFYDKYFSPSLASLVIVGDIEKDEIMPQLTFLKEWEGESVELPDLPQPSAIEKTRVYLANVDNAAQSEIRIGYVTNLPYDATGEYYKVGLMNYVLGGAFNSRINLNLREDKGYTYGARSRFSSSEIPGPYTASAGVRANATDSSVAEFLKEITEYRNGITEEELAFMKSSIGQKDARDYETLYQKAGFLSSIIRYDLDKDFVKKQQEILSNITKEEIDALANKHLPAEAMHIVVVGDSKTVKPGLEKLGYEVIDVSKDGAILSKPEPELGK